MRRSAHVVPCRLPFSAQISMNRSHNLLKVAQRSSETRSIQSDCNTPILICCYATTTTFLYSGSDVHRAPILREFIQYSPGLVAGILFSHPDGSPTLRNEFDVSLKRLLSFYGYQSIAHLKLKFSQYSSIHTNYIIPHCTTLPYNHNI